jgi:hypothetical protein
VDENKVVVWGKMHTVTVEQKSRTVWIAVGNCLGEQIRAQDRSRGAALKRWIEAATHNGT